VSVHRQGHVAPDDAGASSSTVNLACWPVQELVEMIYEERKRTAAVKEELRILRQEFTRVHDLALAQKLENDKQVKMAEVIYNLQWRTAQRELSTRYPAGVRVLVCERAHGTYIAERRFSELVRKHGYKPGGGAIALSSRAISHMDKIASGHRNFCIYISRRSSYDHQEYSAPSKN
jgi:hypothetical protein